MPEYNLVSDLRAANDGVTPITDALRAIDGMNGDVTVVVPSGAYYLSAETHTIDGPDSLTLKPAEDASPAFVAPSGYDGVLLDFQTRLWWCGIDLRREADGAGPQIHISTTGESVVAEMDVTGRDDSDADGGALFVPRARSETSSIAFQNVRSEHGCDWSSSSGGGRCFARIDGENAGTVRFEDCHVGEYSSHGIDALNSQGPLEVEGGSVSNCNGAQIRFGHADSSVRDVDVTVDPDASDVDPSNYGTMAGVQIDTAHTSVAGDVSLRDLHVHVGSSGGGDVTAGIDGTPRAMGVSLRDSRVRVDVDDVPAVDVPAPDSSLSGGGGVSMTNSVCSGNAMTGTAVTISGRPDSTIEDCCIETPGTRRGFDIPPGVTPARTGLKQRCWR